MLRVNTRLTRIERGRPTESSVRVESDITGTKSEDTILASEASVEILSTAPDWPMRSYPTPYGDISRPDILVR